MMSTEQCLYRLKWHNRRIIKCIWQTLLITLFCFVSLTFDKGAFIIHAIDICLNMLLLTTALTLYQ